jgi:hypothetical protein
MSYPLCPHGRDTSQLPCEVCAKDAYVQELIDQIDVLLAERDQYRRAAAETGAENESLKKDLEYHRKISAPTDLNDLEVKNLRSIVEDQEEDIARLQEQLKKSADATCPECRKEMRFDIRTGTVRCVNEECDNWGKGPGKSSFSKCLVCGEVVTAPDEALCSSCRDRAVKIVKEESNGDTCLGCGRSGTRVAYHGFGKRCTICQTIS